MKKPKTMRVLIRTLCAAVIALAWTTPSHATLFTQSFSGSGSFIDGSTTYAISASATFKWDDVAKTLEIDLINTATVPTEIQKQVLTGLFFNQSALTQDHATIVGTVVNGTITNVGDGWGYGSGLSAQGKNSAISASGAVSGLGHSNFSGASNMLDGSAYGIVNNGTYTNGDGLASHGPYVKHEVDFFFKNVSSFSFSQLSSGVVFQYGTDLTEPHIPGHLVPEPGSLAIAGLGGLGLIGYRLRRRRTA